MTTTTRKATTCKIYWDHQDPNGESWAFCTTFDDGHEESGGWEWLLSAHATRQELADAVIELAYENGLVINSDEVHVDERTDGGYAFWHK